MTEPGAREDAATGPGTPGGAPRLGEASRGDLRIELLRSADEARRAADLWRTIWGGAQYPVQPALLVALVHTGGYVSGAWIGDDLVGASMGFPGLPADRLLHSHITGVVADRAGLGVGLALKRHQAAWCRDHGIDRVTWTFDPLVARNAWFNLGRLGVEVTSYHVDHYGEMPDTRNRGQGSDRLLVTWHLDDLDPPGTPDPSPARAHESTPGTGASDHTEARDTAAALVLGEGDHPRVLDVPDDAAAITVALPRDIEALRARDPDLAIAWRHAVRDVLGTRLSPQAAEPWRVTAVTRDGSYLLTRPPTP